MAEHGQSPQASRVKVKEKNTSFWRQTSNADCLAPSWKQSQLEAGCRHSGCSSLATTSVNSKAGPRGGRGRV